MICDLELVEEHEIVDLNIPRHFEGLEFIPPINSYRKKTSTVPFYLAPLERDHLVASLCQPSREWSLLIACLLISLSDFLLGFLLQSTHVFGCGCCCCPIWTFVGKVMSLLFNMLSRVVIAYLPRSKGCVWQETQEMWAQSLGQEDPLKKGMVSPLQYSCLENPMDRGASWAIVHGVTKSRT